MKVSLFSGFALCVAACHSLLLICRFHANPSPTAHLRYNYIVNKDLMGSRAFKEGVYERCEITKSRSWITKSRSLQGIESYFLRSYFLSLVEIEFGVIPAAAAIAFWTQSS